MREILETASELDDLFSTEGGPGASAVPQGRPEPLPEPVGFVTRRLTGPDGSTVEVEVPVYAAAAVESAPESALAEDDASVQLEDLSAILAAEDADPEFTG